MTTYFLDRDDVLTAGSAAFGGADTGDADVPEIARALATFATA